MPRDGMQTSSIGMIKALGAPVLASIWRRGDAGKARRSTAGAATGFEPAMAAEKLRHAGLERRQGIEMV